MVVRDFHVPTAGRGELFIPEWVIIRDMLSVPGGFCTVVGQALVQYYTASLFVLCVNSIFLCVAGFLCYLLLQEIAPRGYNLLLALFPVLGLLKVHTSSFYVLDGTVGLILLLLFSYVLSVCGGRRSDCFMVVVECVSRLWFDWPVGGTLRSGCVVCMSLFCAEGGNGLDSLAVFLAGVLLAYIGIRLAIGIPLTDGI
ncbi:MAG: DUF6057 family protein [Parabacteroides merdae]